MRLLLPILACLLLAAPMSARAQPYNLDRFLPTLDRGLRGLQVELPSGIVSCDRNSPMQSCVYQVGPRVRILVTQPADQEALRGVLITGAPADSLATISDLVAIMAITAMMLEPRHLPSERAAAMDILFPRDPSRIRDGATARIRGTQFTLRRLSGMNAITVAAGPPD